MTGDASGVRDVWKWAMQRRIRRCWETSHGLGNISSDSGTGPNTAGVGVEVGIVIFYNHLTTSSRHSYVRLRHI